MSCLPALGKLAPHAEDHPHRRVKLAPFLPRGFVAPSRIDWTPAVSSWGLYANDTVGDCACAAPANLIRVWTANAGAQRDLPVEAVLAAYTVVSGYTPDQPASDIGAVISDVLMLWHAAGAGGIGGDVLAGFAEVNHDGPFHIQVAVALFGGCLLGLQLPVAAQGATSWSTPPDLAGANAPGSWGGHCALVVAYDADGVLLVTWGGLVRASWGWLACYVDEAWAAISADWLRAGLSPAGFDLAGLQAQLRSIADVGP